MTFNAYSEMRHLCDLWRVVETGSTDESGNKNQELRPILTDIQCRMMDYPKIPLQTTDSIRSSAQDMARFWLSIETDDVQIGDHVRNVRDEWGTSVPTNDFYVFNTVRLMTSSGEYWSVDCLSDVAGVY